ncbi:MAG: PaaX family transcriptional regulator C-terminal domain-containing protein [Solirubrobacteraceae bacterium]
MFALGVTQQAVPGPVDGALLLRVVEDLGLSAPAARAAILRMRREGMLRSERAGRRARYSVSEELAAAQQRWRAHFSAGPPRWDGVFAGLLHDFPERERARRDALRRAARLAGYGLLRPGLLISPDDRWAQLAGRFEPDERTGRILRVGLTLHGSDLPAIAATVWNLDALAQRYRRLAARSRDELASEKRAEVAGPAALRRLEAATRPLYEAVSEDPALPAALLPDDWPSQQLGATLTAALRARAPAAIAHVRALAAALR